MNSTSLSVNTVITSFALLQEDPERVLYLAIPEDAYDRLFTLQFIQDALRYNEVRYLVYDVQAEIIVQWQS
jgi:XisH protein